MTRPHNGRLVANSWSRRSGFTLIEVLVALGLSLVLVSAIYSAISLHWRYETAGRERIERAQISLAVLRLMTEDIGSVVFAVPSTTEEDDQQRPQVHPRLRQRTAPQAAVPPLRRRPRLRPRLR